MRKNIVNIILANKAISIAIGVLLIVVTITIGFVCNKLKKENTETSSVVNYESENFKQSITIKMDTKGIEEGKKIAVFENTVNVKENNEDLQDIEKTESNEGNETNEEKTFIIIALDDKEFQTVVKEGQAYDEGIVLQDGFSINTSNESLIKLASLDKEQLFNYFTVINSNFVEDTSWDNEEDAVDTKVEKEEITNGPKYYIKVSYTSNVVAIYTKDDEGEYTKLVKAMVCSTGTATPRGGTYKLNVKYRWHLLFGGVYGQYCSRITGNILFHSVPYLSSSPDTLEYWEYDKLGTSASAGCVRLTVRDAMWIYNNCPRGTYVEFCTGIDVAKPSAQKISSNISCRNYDPTDPVSNNPWKTYKPNKNNNTSKPVVNNTTNNSHKNENTENTNTNSTSISNNLKEPETENSSKENNVINNNVNTNE